MKKILLTLIIYLFVSACASMGTVESQLSNKEFQQANLPYRDLSVAVISDGSWPQEKIEATISEVSNRLTQQVGIRLKMERWIEHPISSADPRQGLQSLVAIIGKERKKYDLVIGFSERSLPSQLGEMVSWTVWLGAIDDSYRKFIIIKFLDEGVLMHEICHAFVLDRKHSRHGVLNATVFKIPLVPILFNLPPYISIEDREEILRNKWRDFDEKPMIPKKDQADIVVLPGH